MSPAFAAGSTILRREVLHGQVWLQSPVTVIADDGTELAVLLEPGSKFTVPEHPFGPHPWRSFDHWSRTHVLQLYRADLQYSVWMFFESGEFQSWYLNFEAPLVRQVDAIDTLDYGLDLVLGLDGTTSWKDVEDLAPMLRTGRMTVSEVVTVRRTAAAMPSSPGCWRSVPVRSTTADCPTGAGGWFSPTPRTTSSASCAVLPRSGRSREEHRAALRISPRADRRPDPRWAARPASRR